MKKISLFVLALCLFMPKQVFAQQSLDINFCPSTNISMCGIVFQPLDTVPGGTVTYKMPDRFVADSVTFQCLFQNGNFIFQPSQSAETLCALKVCHPGAAKICGIDVPVNAESHAGDVIDLSQTPGVIATNALPTDLRAECDVANGQTLYNISNSFDLSCNVFACQPTQLSACGQTISVVEPANLGAVIAAETPSHQPVSVQCLGSEGLAPHYKIVDEACY